MRKVMSYIKPYVGLVTITIALLFVQAYTDLKLPNYVSKIVDTGIQSSGIEEASPATLTNNAMQFMQATLPQNEAERFYESYELTENQYILKENADRDHLNRNLGESVWMLINLFEGQGSRVDLQNGSLEDLTKLIDVLNTIPNDKKLEVYRSIQMMESSLIDQSATVISRLFYEDAGYNLEALQRSYIIDTGLKMMGMTFIGVVSMITVVYLSARIGAGVSKELRRAVFMKVQSFSNEEIDSFSSSSLVVRTTNDISQIQNLFTFGLRMIVSAPIMAVGGILMIRQHQTNLTWIIIVSCLVLLVLFVLSFLTVVPRFKKQQELVDRLNRVIRESLTGLMVIRAFDNDAFESNRFDVANTSHADNMLYVSRVMAIMMPLLTFIMNITTLAILWFGALQISDGMLRIGDMMAFMQYAMQIISSFLMIAMLFVFIPRAMVSINRVKEVLEKEIAIHDAEILETIPVVDQSWIEFKDVSFRYTDAPNYVLENISFHTSPGKTTAFIGSTGSGKSTLVKLILRFFDVNEGEVLINGKNVRHVAQESLRQLIGYVPQMGMLLSGDVRFNVGYGNDTSLDQDLIDALKISQSQFILDSKEGLDMQIAQGATNISGGQKQRLSIARALAKHPQILIFDDSFSALDFKTDLKLRTALSESLDKTTILIVAQRINTIMDADQIIVLDEGRVVGKGTHQELLKTCDAYYQIALSQLSEEELGHES